MKPVFYSEKLNCYFDSEEECKNKEAEFDAEQERKKKAASEYASSKKAAAKKVTDATTLVDEAYQKYEQAREQADAIMAEAREKIHSILGPAKEAITKAEHAKYLAIAEFNEKYGAFTTTYTGKRAYDEFKRMTDRINEVFTTFRLF